MKNTLSYLLSICLITLTGCSSTSAYLEIGVGYTLDSQSDWFLRTGREWTCDNRDTFHAEVGLEFDKNWKVGYHHQSHVSCGGPFNSDPELYQDEIILTKKWGGHKKGPH